MSDSESDDSSLMAGGYLPSTQKNNSTNNPRRKNNDDGKKSSLLSSSTRPKVSYTGSSKQPLNIESTDNDDCDGDDDDSSASSMLEVLPPKRKAESKTVAVKPAAAFLAKKRSVRDEETSDSDDSLLNDSFGFTTSTTTKKSSKVSQQKSASSTAKTTSSSAPESTNATTSRRTTTTTTSGQQDRALIKQLEKERKKLEQERKKQEKMAEKQAEQARKKAEREAAKEQKQQEKQAAMESRKRRKLDQKQTAGKFFKSEIVLLVDPALFRRPVDHNCYDWREHAEMTEHKFMVKEYPSALGGPNCHALQWIRRDHLQGGASEAWDELRKNNAQGYVHLDRLVIAIDDPKMFIELLRRTPQDDDDDDYPRLRQWLLRLEHGWKAAWPQSSTSTRRPKILLLIHQPLKELDRQWVDHGRANRNSQVRDASLPPPSVEEFHDATTWMLIQFQVECMCCDSYEEIWTTVLKMTRAIAKTPYYNPTSETDCILRIKPMTKDSDSSLDKAKDSWLRQLQQIPGLSEATARNLTRHYPTMQSLWQAYAEAGDSAPELVAGCLHEKQYKKKLSESIHRLLTSHNSQAMI